MRVIAYVAIALVCVACAVPGIAHEQNPGGIWEYKVITPALHSGIKTDIEATFDQRKDESNEEFRKLTDRVRLQQDEKLAESLNKLGGEGWELVSTGFLYQDSRRGARFIFKRRVN